MPRVLAVLSLIGLGLTIYSFIDCVRTPDDQPRGLPKLLWIAVIVLLPWVGSIGWLLGGRPQRPPRQRYAAPLAPDDDPEFLAQLDAQRSQREEDEKLYKTWQADLERREREARGQGDGGTDTTS